MSDTQSKAWVFTINNPTSEPVYDAGTMDYLVWQYEVGKEGTEHIQGYVRYKTRGRLARVKKIDARLHAEAAKGSEQQNRDYCTKDETRKPGTEPHEYGEFKADANKQGKRSDLTELAAKVKSGKSKYEIAQEDPVAILKFDKGITALQCALRPPPPPTRSVMVNVLWGPTGTGKTHRVMTAFPDCFVVSEFRRDPFDGYDMQDVVLFDEFNWTEWPIAIMLKVLDKWRYRITSRYFNKDAYWTMVFICSNSDPTNWYSTELAEVRDAFWRRLTNITYVASKDDAISF